MRKIMEPCGLHCIKMHHITVTFGDQTVLDDINLHIHCGTITAIIGKNGAGKSTLVKALLDDIPHSGDIEFRNLKNEKIQKLKIGYVPQKINIEKYTPLSVYDLFASYQGKVPAFLVKSRKFYEQVKDLLRVFEAEALIDKQVCNLSGGQMQRVLLSLAVMNGPDLLLLDEPEAGIDKNGMELFYKNIGYLKKHFDLAVILISHDLEYVRQYADQVVLLDKKILCQGSAHEVFESKEFKRQFAMPSWQAEEKQMSYHSGNAEKYAERIEFPNVGYAEKRMRHGTRQMEKDAPYDARYKKKEVRQDGGREKR